MKNKQFKFDDEARQAMLRGVIKLSKAVRTTLGPRGRNVVIENERGEPLITKDGVTVAKNIKLKDKMENIAADLVKGVAAKTSDDTGDGTTTATILAQAIFEKGVDAIYEGASPVELKRGIDKAVRDVINYIRLKSIPCNTKEAIKHVGTISANSDEEIGELLSIAMEKVGKEGIITVEDGTGLQNELSVVEGMSFERGYISPYFVTDRTSMTCELHNPYILCVNYKIEYIRDLVPLLEEVIKQKRDILIFAEDVAGEALPALIVNNVNNVLKVCVVKSPGIGDLASNVLDDISVFTGGNTVSNNSSKSLEQTPITQLGQAKKAIITRDRTTVIEGSGKASDVVARIKSISNEIKNDNLSSFEKQLLRQRAARLSGGVAVIKVGAATDVEMKEKKARVEDALHATKAAVEEGIVPGGGVALLRAQSALNTKFGRILGDDLVIDSLSQPFMQILDNAGVPNKEEIQYIVTENDEFSFGYNSNTAEFSDLVKDGVVDPAKVVRSALQNAASVAGLMLTTACMIANEDEVNDYNPKA